MERAGGAGLVIAKADVAQVQQLADVLVNLGQSHAAVARCDPCGGCFGRWRLAAANRERFATVMAPKVGGAWNLHALTREPPGFLRAVLLGCFAAGVSGPGELRGGERLSGWVGTLPHARALPALSINWGAWAQVGMAARPDRVEHLMRQGIMPFTPEQGVRLMERMLERDLVQCMGVAMDWGKILGSYTPPVLSRLSEEVLAGDGPTKKDNSVRKDILATEPEKRRGLVEGFLVEQIAQVLKCSPSKVDAHQPLNRLGIDSLMAVELKNRVEADLETSLPVTVLLQGPSLSAAGDAAARRAGRAGGRSPRRGRGWSRGPGGRTDGRGSRRPVARSGEGRREG